MSKKDKRATLTRLAKSPNEPRGFLCAPVLTSVLVLPTDCRAEHCLEGKAYVPTLPQLVSTFRILHPSDVDAKSMERRTEQRMRAKQARQTRCVLAWKHFEERRKVLCAYTLACQESV